MRSALVSRVNVWPAVPNKKGRPFRRPLPSPRQRAYLAAAFRFAGVLLFAGVFAGAALAAAFRFASVLLFAGIFALAAFFVVFAIVITSIPLLNVTVRIDVNHNEWLFG